MEYNHTFTVDTPARLVVQNIRGAIRVRQGKLGVISVRATLDETSGHPEHTTITIRQSEDGTVEALTDYERPSFWRHHQPSRVTYEIEAPRDTTLRVRHVSGSIVIEGIDGDHRIRNVSGNIDLKDTKGDLDVKVVSGRLSAAGLAGSCQLESVSGSITAERSDLPRGEFKTVSGNMTIETPLGDGPYRFNTVSGNARLILPDAQACTLYASSISGQFKSDLRNARGTSAKRRWQLAFDGGGPEIRMKSVSGSMKLLLDRGSNGATVQPGTPTREDRLAVLTKVSEGQLSIEDAMRKL